MAQRSSRLPGLVAESSSSGVGCTAQICTVREGRWTKTDSSGSRRRRGLTSIACSLETASGRLGSPAVACCACAALCPLPASARTPASSEKFSCGTAPTRRLSAIALGDHGKVRMARRQQCLRRSRWASQRQKLFAAKSVVATPLWTHWRTDLLHRRCMQYSPAQLPCMLLARHAQ